MKFKEKRPQGKPAKKKDLKFTVKSNTELMLFLMESLPGKSRNNIKFLLKEKLILVDDKLNTQFNHPLKPGQIMTILGEKMVPEKPMTGIKIVHEDDAIIVINKFAGLLTNSSAKERIKTAYAMVTNHVRKADAANRVFLINRLDRETSGLIVFAKNEKGLKAIQERWLETMKERIYLALVEGEVRKDKDSITSYLKPSKALIVHSSQNETYGDKAITNYEVFRRKKGTTLLKIQTDTDVKNQIRVHMQEIKHPIVGDKKYGSKINPMGRMALHLKTISFFHPVTKQKVTFDSEIPSKF